MVTRTQRMTVEGFDEWVFLPENVDHDYEYIGGEIVNVVSNQKSSSIAFRIGTYINLYVMEQELGDVTGADGGYMVSSERYMPDVGFISRGRQPEPSKDTYNPNAPDLAVEVLSPTDSEHNLILKIANYLAAGTVVWYVRPEAKVVEVFRPGQPVQVLDDTDKLDGGTILPGFTLSVKTIFAE